MSEIQIKHKTNYAIGIDLVKWAPFAFLGLILLALFAFWPNYLSSPSELGTFYTHLHAITATAWFILLIVQPFLIKSRRRPLHRTIGKTSVVVGPLVLLGMLLGAHGLIGRWPAESWPLARFILYLQISLAFVFGALWLLGMIFRKDQFVHGRFMVATGLTFIDPVLARILPSIPGLSTQLVTFGVVNVILLALIWKERDAKRGRWVFPLTLALFVLIEIPMALGITQSGMWDAFSQWFSGLPLT